MNERRHRHLTATIERPGPTPTRRGFLGSTALALPVAILGGSTAAGADAPGKLGVALCGLGGFSTNSIAPELPSARNVTLAGVITGDAAKGRDWGRKRGFPEKNVFGYDEMARLADHPEIHIVHVATPNGLHAEHAIAAAKAGKHVMCEKPMATGSVQCEAMIAAAKEAGVLLGVSYRLHWEPHHVAAIEAIRGGVIGTPTTGEYEFSWGYAAALADPASARTIKRWLLEPKLAGGGAMFDTGVYPVQAACTVTGKVPVAVRATARTDHPDLFPAGVEETMDCDLFFADGFVAKCRASYASNVHRCLTTGPKGTVEILPGPGGSGFGQSSHGRPSPKKLVVSGRDVAAEDTLQLAVMLDAFARAILENRPFECPGEMGLRDVRIIEAIYASAKRGGEKVEITGIG